MRHVAAVTLASRGNHRGSPFRGRLSQRRAMLQEIGRTETEAPKGRPMLASCQQSGSPHTCWEGAPKGRPMPALGNAQGMAPHKGGALKGRPSAGAGLGRPFRAAGIEGLFSQGVALGWPRSAFQALALPALCSGPWRTPYPSGLGGHAPKRILSSQTGCVNPTLRSGRGGGRLRAGGGFQSVRCQVAPPAGRTAPSVHPLWRRCGAARQGVEWGKRSS